MKKLLYLILIVIFSFKLLPVAWAQDEAPPDPALTQPTTAQVTPAAPAQVVSAPRVVKSNVACTKVGNPTDEKPAICDKTTAPGGPRPEAPPIQGDAAQAIQQQFGITMTGFDQQHLQWAWEKFWEISGTNFNSLINGAIIQTTDVSSTRQVGCPPNLTALIGQFPEETAFKHILTHELGHAIRNCAGRQGAQETAFMNAFNKEGGVSYYAQNANACTGSDSPSEDYAEMIAFYLNPGTPVKSYLKCYQQDQNRLDPQQFPLHYAVAETVLGSF